MAQRKMRTRADRRRQLIEDNWFWDYDDDWWWEYEDGRFCDMVDTRTLCFYSHDSWRRWNDCEFELYPSKYVTPCPCEFCRKLERECFYARARWECLMKPGDPNDYTRECFPGKGNYSICRCAGCIRNEGCECPGCINADQACFKYHRPSLFAGHLITFDCECPDCTYARYECFCDTCINDANRKRDDTLKFYNRELIYSSRKRIADICNTFLNAEYKSLRRCYVALVNNFYETSSLPCLMLQIIIQQFPSERTPGTIMLQPPLPISHTCSF